MSDEKAALKALLWGDFSSFMMKAYETVNPGREFAPNWHLDLMSARLMEVEQGLNRRLILCLCPRSLKSFATSVAFPAWCIGMDPSRRFICISYSDELAVKHSRDSQQIFDAGWYKEAFPKARFDGNKFTE
ncbi:MAG: hypothetical protein GEU28_13235, partial [Dehalococcoidia bacterium]|nr:hypothetical protein [Dehalococcoidia bacterium]